jgi:hypothetical protein
MGWQVVYWDKRSPRSVFAKEQGFPTRAVAETEAARLRGIGFEAMTQAPPRRGDPHLWGSRAGEGFWECRCGVKRQRATVSNGRGPIMYYWPISGRWRRKRPTCPVFGAALGASR